MGIGIQLACLALITELSGMNYMLATLCAVEITILHNFLWHERWTWADRISANRSGSLVRMARFNMTNGMISICGNAVLMGLFVEEFRLNYLIANLLAIGVCAILNFIVSDRFVFA